MTDRDPLFSQSLEIKGTRTIRVLKYCVFTAVNMLENCYYALFIDTDKCMLVPMLPFNAYCLCIGTGNKVTCIIILLFLNTVPYHRHYQLPHGTKNKVFYKDKMKLIMGN